MTAGSADIFERDLQGFKHFRSLRKLLSRLHEVGTKRDTAGNRQSHMDQYCVLVLLWLFNPAIRTLRGLQRVVEFDKVRKRLRVDRTSLGSLSESVRIFDPTALAHIAAELSLKLPTASCGRFDAVQQQLTAVDGSVVSTIVRVARLSWTPKGKGASASACRLHAQFEVLRGVPSRIDVTPANHKGENGERAVLARTIQRDRCYVIDRVYAQFTPWNAIVATKSSYVCRVRDNSAFRVERVNELTPADQAAGVQGDEIVIIGGRRDRPYPDHPVRLVTVKATPHRPRGRNAGSGCDGTLRIATSRLDLLAELISEIYRQRWLSEVFFRMFKQMLVAGTCSRRSRTVSSCRCTVRLSPPS